MDPVAIRASLGIGGVYLLADALLSITLSTDRRPLVQIGRIGRFVLGVSMGLSALVWDGL